MREKLVRLASSPSRHRPAVSLSSNSQNGTTTDYFGAVFGLGEATCFCETTALPGGVSGAASRRRSQPPPRRCHRSRARRPGKCEARSIAAKAASVSLVASTPLSVGGGYGNGGGTEHTAYLGIGGEF
ncbi:hypothetical protein [Bradyrhizobium sp.]|uniref:hypothetical protein n=1 Tax=Bradyrhizobium sp. TaxID=376 RepID=UPI0039E653E4